MVALQLAAAPTARSSPSRTGVPRSSSVRVFASLKRPDRPKMSDVPRLIAFDLDGTLWFPEMYMLDGAPFKKDATGKVFDRSGQRVRLIGESLKILQQLATDPKFENTQVAYVSRTEYPEWAIPCLKLFDIEDGMTAYDLAPYQEIYPGSKRNHFKAIKDKTGIPYENMLFFDNERWNCTDCEPLGITCVYTPRGMTDQVWQQGLREFAGNRDKVGSLKAAGKRR